MRLAFATTCCVALSLAASGASAQGDPAKDQALARYQEGVALHDRGRDEDAYVRFTQAYAVVQTPPILFNLARTEQLTGRLLDAAAHFRTYVAWPEHPRITRELRAAAQASLGELNAQLGHLSITAPEGSHVRVDGREVGIAPLKEAVDVLVGLHKVEAAGSGSTLQESVNAGKGKLTDVAFMSPVVADTHVVVGAVPVPGPAVLPAPLPPVGVEEPVKPVPYWNGQRTVGIVIAGVGVVGMVVGGVFGAERGSETNDASAVTSQAGASNSRCFGAASASAPCQSLANALSANGTDAAMETGFLIGGGVLLAIGAVLTLWPGRGHDSRTGLTPIVAPGLAGLSWGGSF
jgi:hypothetical protein